MPQTRNIWTKKSCCHPSIPLLSAAMEARRPDSKKWTSFPKEYVEQIQSVFQDSFRQSLGPSQLVVEGKIFAREICMRIGFREPHQLRQNNFEVSIDFQPDKENAIEQIYYCIDAVATLMTSYFEGTDPITFPVTWKPFDFEKRTLFFQFSTINTDLESEADRLLGETKEQLVQESSEEHGLGASVADPFDDSTTTEGETPGHRRPPPDVLH